MPPMSAEAEPLKFVSAPWRMAPLAPMLDRLHRAPLFERPSLREARCLSSERGQTSRSFLSVGCAAVITGRYALRHSARRVRRKRRGSGALAKNVDASGSGEALHPLADLPKENSAEPKQSPFHFARYANWVAPRHFLVGRYPLTSPGESAGRDLLRALAMDAGVTTFVSLQSELPPQSDPKWPRDGVRVKGRTCLPYARLAQQFALGRKLQFLHEFLEDLAAPEEQLLNTLIADLKLRVLSGEVLYIHCMGGRGRSGVVAACLLSSLYGLPAEESLQRVQFAYDSRDYDNSASPETEQQRELVYQFCKGLTSTSP